MNLRHDRLKTFAVMPMQIKKDKEGSAYPSYGGKVRFRAEMWQAGGQVQQQMYGQKLPEVRNLRLDGKYKEVTEGTKTCYHVTQGNTEFDITVNDGVCINNLDAEEPDYKITAIYPYRFLQVEVQRL